MKATTTIEPTRFQRAGWKTLTVIIFGVTIFGLWASLNLDPEPLTVMAIDASIFQINGWLLIVAVALYGLWKVSALLVARVKAAVHSGRHLFYDLPVFATGLLALSILLALVAPFTGALPWVLAAALFCSAAGGWVQDVSRWSESDISA